MKNSYVFVLLCFLHTFFFAQNVGINSTGAAPNASALLDIDNGISLPKKGLLIPRMTQEERLALITLAAVAKGLLIYQTNGLEGFYYNTSTTTTPNWVYLFNSNSSNAWLINGNIGTVPSTSPIGTTVNNNVVGTNDNKDLVLASNNLERMRITGGGLIGINTVAPISTALLTIKATTNDIRSGIDITLIGANSNAYGLNISTANSNASGVFYNSTSSANGVFYGLGASLSNSNIVSGYNAYRNTSGLSYGIYGVNGTITTYATNANTWAAFLQGRTVISSESAPTSDIGTDLEIRNTSPGLNPVNLGLRQTTSNTNINAVLGNLFFGDNHSNSAQAQISAIRSASGGAADLPTDLTFATTPDGSSILIERMRLTNLGNLLIGTTTSVNNAKLSIKDGHIQVSQITAPTITVSSNAGTGASAVLTLNSNDVVGNIVLTAGNSAFSSGEQCTFTFNRPYAKAPVVMLMPTNAFAASNMSNNSVFVTSTISGFTISFGVNNGPSSSSFEWNYMIIEP